MSCILHIETSTDVCSVALSQDGLLLHEETSSEGPSHARLLSLFVAKTVSFADNHAIPIDAVAVSKGPGSYTGLRIGVSEAKGFAYGRSIKLLSVPTLKLLTVPTLLDDLHPLPENALLCPMIDARRMEVYCSVYDRALREVRATSATIIESHSFADLLDQCPIYFMGNGADKCSAVIKHQNAHFIKGRKPLARHMIPLAEMALARGEEEDVAYFEPFYLKDFIATKSKSLL